MDNRITKKRFSDLWDYDWIKMLCAFLASILVWCLIFDTAAPRLLAGQDFTVFIYPTIYSSAATSIDEDFEKRDDILSYDILEKSTYSITDKVLSQILSTRAATHEGDIMLLDNTITYSADDAEGTEHFSNYQSFVDSYLVEDFDTLLLSALKYAAGFTSVEIQSDDTLAAAVEKMRGASVDADKVYQAFKIRKKKDNAYKTEQQYKDGAVEEQARINTIINRSIALFDAFSKLDEAYEGAEKNPLRAVYKRYSAAYYSDSKNYKEVYEAADNTPKTYGIDLGGVETAQLDGKSIKKAEIGNYFRLYDSGENATSKNVILTVYDYGQWQKDLQYESVSFIWYVLQKYTVLFD